jgi:DNA-binding response OmpR family regulator
MRILVVEDDALVAQALKLLLSERSYGVDIAPDGQQTLALLESFEYDLVMLDLLLPDTDGVQLCQRLRARGYSVPILLLTGQNNVAQKALALNAGADDYVVKPFDSRELLARVQALLRRGTVLPSSLLSWGELRLNPSSRQVTYGGQEVVLTPKEYGLLELLLRHSDRTFSAKVILDRVWAAEDYPGEEAVRTHVKGLRHKLRLAGAPADLIETIHRVGYRLNPLQNLAAPLAAAAPPPMDMTATDMTATDTTVKDILAVVPESVQPSLQRALLDQTGLRLATVSQYTDVLAVLADHAPGLLILSYDLDEGESLCLCRDLRQSEQWRQLPVMFLLLEKTACAIDQVFEAGASDILLLPVVGPELRTRIANQLRLAALGHAPAAVSPRVAQGSGHRSG